MGYLAIARQWRPSRFDDLVGQEHVVQTLKNAIRLNRVSHAYLFSGARGIGKTSVARIFAKALRCPNIKPEDAVPCNLCPECMAISESRSVDVVEIDGASNNGVEAVRGIRENIAYGASSGTYKIYIIDEVHMLSLSAFNALLKTLEEPPAHVIFIFATTEVQKIPLTILSRCQRFEFRRLTNAQIVARLQHILGAEQMALSEEALRAMASHADGSLRDALSLLDQVLSYFGERGKEGSALNEKQIVEALGISDSSVTRQLLSLILSADIAGIIGLIGETYLSGVDLKHFSERCLEELRLLYLVALAKETNQAITAEVLDISLGHFGEIAQMVKDSSLIQIERMAQIFGHTIHQLGWTSNPRFVMEMAAVRMSKLGALEQLEQAIQGSGSGQLPEEEKPNPLDVEDVAPAPVTVTVTSSAPIVISPIIAAVVPRAADPSTQSWKSFVDALMKKRPIVGALLSHANFRMQDVEGAKVIRLAFPAGSFYERQTSDGQTKAEIEEQVRTFFGAGTRVELSNTLEDTSVSLEETRRIDTAAAKKSALQHPTVLKVKEVLGADVVDVTIDS